jgi:protein Tex
MHDTRLISAMLSIRPEQASAAIKLLDAGAAVPFIARYRKELTGGLDNAQLRRLQQRLCALRALEARRNDVRRELEAKGQLDAVLAAEIGVAESDQRLDDLLACFSPPCAAVRQAIRLGLDALADALIRDPAVEPLRRAEAFCASGPPDAAQLDPLSALDGARSILIERFAARADSRQVLRERLWREGRLRVTRTPGAHPEADKYRDYFNYEEALSSLPSHRALALLRAGQQGILALRLEPAARTAPGEPDPYVVQLAGIVGLGESVRNLLGGGRRVRAADDWLIETARACWEQRLFGELEAGLFSRLRQAAEDEAIRVFGANLRDLLLAPPAGRRPVLGLDPGHRSGVRVALVDEAGGPLEALTLHPGGSSRERAGAIATLAAMAARYRVHLIAIGNGAAARDTDRLAADLIARHPELGLRRVLVSEAGAAVYAQSEIAARELPGLEPGHRGAVSIARRLQDPLAELVKIDPRSIGVGQYQHDVDQQALSRQLDAVVEDCVNLVGVDPNAASAPLLARVAGIGSELARRIVEHREAFGPFTSRNALRQVPGFDDACFEQAAGFLRIREAADPLDASAVHPEAYPLVRRMLHRLRLDAQGLIGNRERLRRIRPADFSDAGFGEPTVRDILAELERPGRDPRGDFVTPVFQDGIERITDLRVGMRLQGVVTNVANFGAFVDIGVCQDGMIHLSELSDRFVRDPRDIVRVGQVVEVTVIMADVQRRRIGLSMRSEPGRGSGIDVPRLSTTDAARGNVLVRRRREIPLSS